MAEGMESGMNEGYEKLDELLARREADMGNVVASASTSLDGFVAYPNNDPGRALRLVRGGRRRDRQRRRPSAVPPDTRRAPTTGPGGRARSAASSSGALLFDITDGWKGEHPLGVPFVVLTHEPPTDWAHAAYRQRALRHGRASRRRSRGARRSPATRPSASPPARSPGRRSPPGCSTRSRSTSCRSCSATGTVLRGRRPDAVRLGDPTRRHPARVA